jgi:hypothetical protein
VEGAEAVFGRVERHIKFCRLAAIFQVFFISLSLTVVMDPNTSYDFSSGLSTSAQSRRDAHKKRWSWLNKLVNKVNNEPLYNS